MDDGTSGAVRVSDAERGRVADRLGRAQAEGRLDLHEFDRRVGAAYAAVVRADLVPLTADLPVEATDPAVATSTRGPSAAAVAPPRSSSRPGPAAAVGVWAAVSALNLAIWTVVTLAAPGPVYPWWIWVAGPWGAMLAVRALTGGPGPSRVLAFVSPTALTGSVTCAGRRRR